MYGLKVGTPIVISSTNDVTTKDCQLIGFFVNSTSSGTLTMKKGGTSGTAISGTITPAVGFYSFPASCPGGLFATITGAMNVTFFIIAGSA
jgi:hypothetical protein